MCQLGVVSTAIEDLGSLLPPQGAYAMTPSPPSNPQWYKYHMRIDLINFSCDFTVELHT